jgi:hypothetical protein
LDLQPVHGVGQRVQPAYSNPVESLRTENLPEPAYRERRRSPERPRDDEYNAQDVRPERHHVLGEDLGVVGGVKRRRATERDQASRLGERLEGPGKEPAEEPEGPERHDGGDEEPGDGIGLRAAFAEKQTGPEAPGVGEGRGSAHDGEGGEERAALERGGEEELVGKKADRERERDEGGRSQAARRGEQGHRSCEAPEPAKSVFARGLRHRARGQEKRALGDGVRDHVERRPASAIGTAETVHRDYEPVLRDGRISEELLEHVPRQRQRAADRHREEADHE